ncbi:hypothetical protein HDU93_003029 [Gonapodya sp. JEL0774]|nr:hypothetical protein HDU93_003029 [Gonapodya sp. JEL0774]
MVTAVREPTAESKATNVSPRPIAGQTQRPIQKKRGGFGGLVDRISSWLGEGRAHVVSEDFVTRRRLGEKVATTFDIYSFGMGMVLCGFVTSWNYGLAYGWGSYLISFLIMSASIWSSVLCWAELTSALPFVGGQTTWATVAFGSVGGMIAGQLDIVFWTLILVQLYSAIGWLLGSLLATQPNLHPIFWIVAATLANVLLMAPVKWVFRLVAISSWGTLLLLVGWFAVTVPNFDFQANIVNGGLPEAEIEAAGFGGGVESTFHLSGIVAGLVTAVWFFSAIESLPHCAEEAIDIPKAIPRSYNWLMLTIFVWGGLCIVVSPSAAPGIFALSSSDSPLVDNIVSALASSQSSSNTWTLVLSIWPVFGSIVASTYTLGRVIYANSRAGYLPQALSLTMARTGSPAIAHLASSVAGFLIMLTLSFSNNPEALTILVMLIIVYEQLGNLSKAVIYCRLKRTMPILPRPYKSPFGLPGGIFAVVSTVTCVLSMLIFQPYTRLTIIIFAAHIAVCVPYYVFHVKQTLLLTPEKQFLKEQIGYLFNLQTLSSLAISGNAPRSIPNEDRGPSSVPDDRKLSETASEPHRNSTSKKKVDIPNDLRIKQTRAFDHSRSGNGKE